MATHELAFARPSGTPPGRRAVSEIPLTKSRYRLRTVTGFSAFIQRRRRVQRELGQGVLVLFAATPALRNNDVTHEFRQDSDFYYLTGFDEPDAALVLIGGDAPRSVLFVNARDPEREVWDGVRLGVEGAKSLGLDEAFPSGELDERLPRLLTDRPQLACRFAADPVIEPRLAKALALARLQTRRGHSCPTTLIDSATLVHEMRRKKEPGELELMERAVAITRDAHLASMAQARAGMFEYEIEATLRSVFRASGSERVAYEPIVASGHNATVLHYVKNQRQMQDGELLLIDAGCEFGYYAADITRTFPVSGRFSPAQREIYDLVLRAQKAAIVAAGPGVTLDTIHQAATRVICEGLIELGVLRGSATAVEAEGSYKAFFMHKTSHYLGMDVHDVGRYFEHGKPRPLERGVVITVEPGLYFPLDAPEIAARYRGIGVRIEDDVLIEAAGVRVLSDGLPKELDEIEHACLG
jgi:Xaa-Pro aminopeptidase